MDNSAPLYEYKSGSMGPTASDDLNTGMQADRFGNLNLRVKEIHLRVVLITQETKGKLSFQQFIFFYSTHHQAFKRTLS